MATPHDNAALTDLLHPQLLQAVAMVRLLLKGWLEPVRGEHMHLSTLVHQILSMLKETGGQTAVKLYRSLCQEGPFRLVTPGDFKVLLQGLHGHRLIEQDAEGILYLGLAGERITSAPGFYAAFATPVELKVRWGAKELGRLPAVASLKEGQCLLLNGRRWTVDTIAWKSRSIWVSPTVRKQAPVFLGAGGEINDLVFQEMREVLLGQDEPEWLDATSREVLQSARETARGAGLHHGDVLNLDDAVQWFPWCGTRTMRTLELWAQDKGLDCTTDALSLTFQGMSPEKLEGCMTEIIEGKPDAVRLAALMANKTVERFDSYVDEDLLNKANSKFRLDLASAAKAARRAINTSGGGGDDWLIRR
jgi:ATP-dependent Lhr-like helicase